MIIADLGQIEGRRYPARRRTQNLVGGASPIQAQNFSMGFVTLDANGGQGAAARRADRSRRSWRCQTGLFLSANR